MKRAVSNQTRDKIVLNPESFAGRRFLSEWRDGTQTNNQTIPAFQDFVRFKDFFVDLSLIIEIIYVKRDTKMEFLVVEPLRSGNGGTRTLDT